MSNSTPTQKRPLADYLGISSATICLIHCLATPILLSMGISVHEHHEGHEHGWMLLLAHGWDFVFLGFGFLAVFWSSRHTFHLGRKLLLWASFLFLAAAVLMEEHGATFQYLTYIASLALIATHAANIKAILTGRQEAVVCESAECQG